VLVLVLMLIVLSIIELHLQHWHPHPSLRTFTPALHTIQLRPVATLTPAL